MTDLRALLGDRYGKTVPEACLAAAYGWHDATCPESRDCPSRDMHSEDDSRVRELQARLDAVVALARKWATQPTDWDEDTEQQIEDGTELLTLLGLTLEEQP